MLALSVLLSIPWVAPSNTSLFEMLRRPIESTEYAAFGMRDALSRHGFVQSMNRPGMMNDNAHMESFFHSMKTEALYGLTFDTDNALRSELRSYIQFYNHERLHSALDYLPPVAFERREARQSCVN